MRNPLTFRIETWLGSFFILAFTIFMLIRAFGTINDFNDELQVMTIMETRENFAK